MTALRTADDELTEIESELRHADASHLVIYHRLRRLLTVWKSDSFPFLNSENTSLPRIQRACASLNRKKLGLSSLQIVIGGAAGLQPLGELLNLYLLAIGIDAEILISGSVSFDSEIRVSGSSLYKKSPDLIWMIPSAEDRSIASYLELKKIFESRWSAVRLNSNAAILQSSIEIGTVRALGHRELSEETSLHAVHMEFNRHLSRQTDSGFAILDNDWLASIAGKDSWLDPRFRYFGDLTFNPRYIPFVAYHAARVIAGMRGLSKRALIVDLDGTLWGGVVGDDLLAGIKIGNVDSESRAYADFQKYLRQLKDRGILLAVSSKNVLSIAREPFERKPDMPLQFEDFVAFEADWRTKVEHVESIARKLGLPLSSLVFVDDNPIEREMVRTSLPDVTVPEMPSDASFATVFLDAHRLFESSVTSQEDRHRTKLYQDDHRRTESASVAVDIDSFLSGLGMHSVVRDFAEEDLPRIVQLINKTNQFNLTTRRRTEAEVKAIMKDPSFITRTFTLSDKFGNSGLVSVLIAKRESEKLTIDTWLMSCRVIGRRLENFVQNEIVKFARENAIKNIVGELIKTERNTIVHDLFQRFGYINERLSTGEASGVEKWKLKVASNVGPSGAPITAEYK